MKAAFFLGCTVPVRNLNYEASARLTADKFGLELVDINEFQCCGFPIKSLSIEDSLLIAARNLALAGKQNLPVITLCSACGVTLGEAAYELDSDDKLRDSINEKLRKINLEYKPGIEVTHFIRYLAQNIGYETIKSQIVKPLTGFKFSPHYGCHYVKPKRVIQGFDDSLRPSSLARLLEAIGAETVNDGSNESCCGGGLLGSNEDLANQLVFKRLNSARQSEVDGLVLMCPFCNVMLEGQQKKVFKAADIKSKVPIFFYPQLLGLALGFSPAEMGFKLNRIKNKELIKAFESE